MFAAGLGGSSCQVGAITGTTNSLTTTIPCFTNPVPQIAGARRILQLSLGDLKVPVPDPGLETHLLSRNQIELLAQKTCCSNCLQSKYTVTFAGNGVGGNINFECGYCRDSFKLEHPKLEVDNQTVPLTNFANTYMALRNDLGFMGLSRQNGGFGLDPGSETSFYR